MLARLLPWFCMRVRRAREAAVSAVSPAEKKAESIRLTSTIRRASQVSPITMSPFIVRQAFVR